MAIPVRRPPPGRRVKIEGLWFSLMRDIDQRNLRKLLPHGRVTWLHERIKFTILNPIDHMLPTSPKSDMWNERTYGLFLIVTVICCAIEGMGSFLMPRYTRPGKKFDAFAHRYLRIPKPVTTIPWLWHGVRNALAHSLCIIEGGLNGPKQPYIKRSKDGPLMDVWKFYADFKRGVDSYFRDLSHSKLTDPIFVCFQNRFQRIIVQGKRD